MFELLLVVAIAAVIFTIVAPVGISLYRAQLVEEVRSNIIDALQKARHNSILQKGDTAYGVRVVAGSYTIFQGVTYDTRNIDGDEVFPVASNVSFSGWQDIIFAKLTGLPNATGTLAINYNDMNRGIAVDISGGISKVDVVGGVEVVTATYSVTFDANGGIGSMSAQTFDSGSTANLSINTYTRSSYVFVGWATSVGGAVSYADGASYTMGSANATLYAKWITVPGAPTIGTATAGNATSSVTFTAPASDGGATITGYTVTSSPGGLTGTGSASPIIVTGLSNGTAYTFTVTATNSVGTGTSSVASNSIIPSAISAGGLVSYWPFDGNANDIIGSNHGTVYGGASLASGLKGVTDTAYSFDGVDDYINVNSSFGNPNTVTISVWFKTSSNGIIFNQHDTVSPPTSANSHVPALWVIPDGRLRAELWSGSIGAIYSSNSVADNNWHLATLVGNTNIQYLYLDGVLVNSRSGNLSQSWWARTTFGVGYAANREGSASVWKYFPGSLDQVHIYNRALSGSEILVIYNEEKPTIVVPGAPTIGTATAGNASSSVTFTAPVFNGYENITSYTVTSSPGGLTGTGSASPIIVTGLSNGTAYTFTVTATNSAGTSLSSGASNTVMPTVVSGGLASFWPFDGNANDLASTSNGTVYGATATTGTRGIASTAYNFNANTDYIGGFGDNFDMGTNNQTISAWYKGGTLSQIGMIVGKSRYAGGAGRWAVYLTTAGKVGMFMNCGGADIDGIGTNSRVITDNVWHHIVGVWDRAGNFTTYVDGVADGVVSISSCNGYNMDNPYYFLIGTYGDETGTGGIKTILTLKGSLDQIRYYNRALSASEILEIFNTESPWYNSAWAYRTRITIDRTKVASSTGTLLANFPVLISTTSAMFKDTSNSGHVGQADGGDIVFTSADGITKLDHEIESYTPASGNLITWVEVPSVATTTNTDIYMYYGNASVANQWNASGTWDSNYKGVWHLSDAGNSTSTDSTSNGNNGTNNGVTATSSGQINGGSYFNGAGYINIPSNSNLNAGNSGTTLTVSAWVNPTTAGTDQTIASKWDYNTQASWGFQTGAGGEGGASNLQTYIPSTVTDIGDKKVWTTDNGLSSGSWQYVLFVYDGSQTGNTNRVKIYINGNLKSEASGGTVPSSASGGSASVKIGKFGGNLTRYFSGSIDEVHISSVARSADWIKTEYNNQSAPNTFYTIGSEVTY